MLIVHLPFRFETVRSKQFEMVTTCRTVFALMLWLAGCNSVAEGMSPVPTPQSEEDFTEAFASFSERYASAVSLPELQVAPAVGTASFAGELALDLSGDVVGTAIASLRLMVDFSRNEVTGTTEDFLLAVVHGDVFDLPGSLAVSGALQGHDLAGRMNGQVQVPGSAGSEGMEADLALVGLLRGFDTTATAATGSVTGEFRGSRVLEVSNGAFYAVRE